MRNILAVCAAVVSLSLVGCGGKAPETTTEPTPETAEQSQGLKANGTGCSADTECASGLCWDVTNSYGVYDPSTISADSCTEECAGPTDHASCRAMAADLGAPYPNSARCIPADSVYDNDPYQHHVYICDLLPAGLGAVHWVE